MNIDAMPEVEAIGYIQYLIKLARIIDLNLPRQKN